MKKEKDNKYFEEEEERCGSRMELRDEGKSYAKRDKDKCSTSRNNEDGSMSISNRCDGDDYPAAKNFDRNILTHSAIMVDPLSLHNQKIILPAPSNLFPIAPASKKEGTTVLRDTLTHFFENKTSTSGIKRIR